MKINKGFTLIELLIVISIIGVLSSIVMTSLGNARYRANDAAIKSDMSSLRAAAQIYNSSNGESFGTQAFTANCGGAVAGVFSDSDIQKYIDDAVTNSGQTAATAAKCVASTNAYVVAVQLRGNPSTGWCVDSLGNSRQISWSNFGFGDTNCIDANGT